MATVQTLQSTMGRQNANESSAQRFGTVRLRWGMVPDALFPPLLTRFLMLRLPTSTVLVGMTFVTSMLASRMMRSAVRFVESLKYARERRSPRLAWSSARRMLRRADRRSLSQNELTSAVASLISSRTSSRISLAPDLNTDDRFSSERRVLAWMADVKLDAPSTAAVAALDDLRRGVPSPLARLFAFCVCLRGDRPELPSSETSLSLCGRDGQHAMQ